MNPLWKLFKLLNYIINGRISLLLYNYIIMLEQIIKFEKSRRLHKKYVAYIQNRKTKKVRLLNFGDNRYQQYKDTTPLKLYRSLNHGSRKRMRNYFNRHSGTPFRAKAIAREKKNSKNLYTPKLLSHIYLW